MKRTINDFITDAIMALWITGILPLFLSAVLIGGLGALLG